MLLYIPRTILSDLGDTSGSFFDILFTQILVVLLVIMNIRGADKKKNDVQIGHSVACQVKKELNFLMPVGTPKCVVNLLTVAGVWYKSKIECFVVQTIQYRSFIAD